MLQNTGFIPFSDYKGIIKKVIEQMSPQIGRYITIHDDT